MKLDYFQDNGEIDPTWKGWFWIEWGDRYTVPHEKANTIVVSASQYQKIVTFGIESVPDSPAPEAPKPKKESTLPKQFRGKPLFRGQK
jgi:hypothetical protein